MSLASESSASKVLALTSSASEVDQGGRSDSVDVMTLVVIALEVMTSEVVALR